MEYFRRLKIIREQNNMTQKHLADALGITRSAYCSYEIGRRSPDVDTIVKLAKFYQLPLESFLGDTRTADVYDNGNFETGDLRFLAQLSKNELDMVVNYRIMNENDKKEIRDLVKSKIVSKD